MTVVDVRDVAFGCLKYPLVKGGKKRYNVYS